MTPGGPPETGGKPNVAGPLSDTAEFMARLDDALVEGQRRDKAVEEKEEPPLELDLDNLI